MNFLYLGGTPKEPHTGPLEGNGRVQLDKRKFVKVCGENGEACDANNSPISSFAVVGDVRTEPHEKQLREALNSGAKSATGIATGMGWRIPDPKNVFEYKIPESSNL